MIDLRGESTEQPSGLTVVMQLLDEFLEDQSGNRAGDYLEREVFGLMHTTHFLHYHYGRNCSTAGRALREIPHIITLMEDITGHCFVPGDGILFSHHPTSAYDSKCVYGGKGRGGRKKGKQMQFFFFYYFLKLTKNGFRFSERGYIYQQIQL